MKSVKVNKGLLTCKCTSELKTPEAGFDSVTVIVFLFFFFIFNIKTPHPQQVKVSLTAKLENPA